MKSTMIVIVMNLTFLFLIENFIQLTHVFISSKGKLPLSGIAVNRLEDTDIIRNSFEITGQ